MNLATSIGASVLVALAGGAAYVGFGGKGLCSGGSCAASASLTTTQAVAPGTQHGPNSDAIAGGMHGPEADSLAKASAAGTFNVDPVHSSIHFMINHAGIANFYGRFNEFSGSFTMDSENPGASSLEFTVKVETVDTNNQGRDDHLRAPDFFNARQFPEAKFKSTSFSPGSGEGQWVVEGNLTIHGETKPVTVNLNWLGTGTFRNNDIAAFEANFTFKRGDFGMTTYLADDGGDDGPLGNTVTVLVSVEGGRQ